MHTYFNFFPGVGQYRKTRGGQKKKSGVGNCPPLPPPKSAPEYGTVEIFCLWVDELYKVKPCIFLTLNNEGVDCDVAASAATGCLGGARTMISCVKPTLSKIWVKT